MVPIDDVKMLTLRIQTHVGIAHRQVAMLVREARACGAPKGVTSWQMMDCDGITQGGNRGDEAPSISTFWHSVRVDRRFSRTTDATKKSGSMIL